MNPSIAISGYHAAYSSPPSTHPTTPLSFNRSSKRPVSDDVDDRGSSSPDDVIRAEAGRRWKRRRRGQLESRNELRRRIKTLLRTDDVKALHPSATCLGGHRISIPRVSLSTFRYITELIDRGKLDEARRWRIGYDSSHSTKGHRGKLSIRMPSTTHEILARFAPRIAEEVWANEGEGSFIPLSMRHKRDAISDWRSAGRMCNLDSSYYLVRIPSADLAQPHIPLGRPGKGVEVKVPDAGLRLYIDKLPFMVLDIAVTQDEKEVSRKAKRYIRASLGIIRFAIVILVEANAATTAGAASSSTRMEQQKSVPSVTGSFSSMSSSSSPLSLLPFSPSPPFTPPQETETTITNRLRNRNDYLHPADKVYVWVYKAAFKAFKAPGSPLVPPPEADQGAPPASISPGTSRVQVDAECIIDKTEVYPAHDVAASFGISWSDLTKVPPADAPPPFRVRLDGIHNLAVMALDPSAVESSVQRRCVHPFAVGKSTSPSSGHQEVSASESSSGESTTLSEYQPPRKRSRLVGGFDGGADGDSGSQLGESSIARNRPRRLTKENEAEA